MTTGAAAPPMLSVRELIKMYGLSAKRQLSQNFILDLQLTDRIAGVCHLADRPALSTAVIEVGSGPGGLTRSLLKHESVARVLGVEKDKRFLSALGMLAEHYTHEAGGGSRFEVVRGDILDIDEGELISSRCSEILSPPSITTTTATAAVATSMSYSWSMDPADTPVRVVGNLPFNVSTPLLVKWMKAAAKREGVFTHGRIPHVLMFQKEVGERMAAFPGNRTYSRLSVLVQHVCTVEPLIRVPGSVFVPPPKVDAVVVRLTPHVERVGGAVDIDTLEYVTGALFNQRRKTIRRSIKQLGDAGEEALSAALGSDRGSARPEQLDVEEFVTLAREFGAVGGVVPRRQARESRGVNSQQRRSKADSLGTACVDTHMGVGEGSVSGLYDANTDVHSQSITDDNNGTESGRPDDGMLTNTHTHAKTRGSYEIVTERRDPPGQQSAAASVAELERELKERLGESTECVSESVSVKRGRRSESERESQSDTDAVLDEYVRPIGGEYIRKHKKRGFRPARQRRR